MTWRCVNAAGMPQRRGGNSNLLPSRDASTLVKKQRTNDPDTLRETRGGSQRSQNGFEQACRLDAMAARFAACASALRVFLTTHMLRRCRSSISHASCLPVSMAALF